LFRHVYINIIIIITINTSADGPLVTEDIIYPIVSVSALTWFTWQIHHMNLQFQNYVNIKTKFIPLGHR
jgi:hypothetical protein